MRELLVTELDKRFDTREASAFLTASGYTTGPATLNKLRCVGGGPAFEKFGRRPLYSEASLLEWVQSRTTRTLRSTSDIKNTARPIESPRRLLSRPLKPAVETNLRVP
jgi:hypothetical protein